MRLIRLAATAWNDTKGMKSGLSVNCATSGFMKPVLKSNQHLSRCFSLFCSKVFMLLYKSVLPFTVQWKLVALIFPQNYLLKPTFKQFISVSHKMCWMDTAENYVFGFTYHKYET